MPGVGPPTRIRILWPFYTWWLNTPVSPKAAFCFRLTLLKAPYLYAFVSVNYTCPKGDLFRILGLQSVKLIHPITKRKSCHLFRHLHFLMCSLCTTPKADKVCILYCRKSNFFLGGWMSPWHPDTSCVYQNYYCIHKKFKGSKHLYWNLSFVLVHPVYAFQNQRYRPYFYRVMLDWQSRRSKWGLGNTGITYGVQSGPLDWMY